MASAAIIHFRRKELEKRIQELVDLLDLIDGDPDREDNGDGEPWLSGCSDGHGDEDLEDDRECEPSLGWNEAINQSTPERFGPLGSYDLEADTGRIYGGCGL